jgi:UDP-N-acetylmuramate dehydrogenase
VSQKHANFIVNHGGATANDVRGLIVYVQKTVFEKMGVLLEPEVVFVGEFEEELFRP